jgi:L-serine dehydratase
MRGTVMFVGSLERDRLLPLVAGIRAELFGSLAATGHGHGSVKAVALGLVGEPETVDPAAAEPLLAAVRSSGTLRLLGRVPVAFNPDEDVILHRRKRLDVHPNGMRSLPWTLSGPAVRPHLLLGRRWLRARRGRSWPARHRG